MIWLLPAFAAVVVSAVLVATLLRPTPTGFAVGVFVLASAEIIALTEVLSLLGVARAAGYAVGEALILAAAAAAWHRAGRPRPPLPAVDLRAAARAHPLVAVLGLFIGAALVYQAFIVFGTPPNNWDSMSYHLSRAAGWYQRHRIEYFPTHTERENAFQPNAEMEILYTFAFVGRDTAAAATQLLAELSLLAGVAGCARRLGFSRAGALFAALLTATLSEIALQSVTTQNDLVAASFLVSAACLLLGSARNELLLAGVAVGLALGTKLTTAAALPLLALLVLTRRPWRRRLLETAAYGAAGFVLLGAYGYALNLGETGRVLGEQSAQSGAAPDAVTASGTVSSVARMAYRFVDLSGFRTSESVTGWIAARGEDIFDALGIAQNPDESTGTNFSFSVNRHANEDYSFFGPLGFLLLPALGIGFLVACGRRRAPPATAVLALAAPVYLVAIALSFDYNVWIGRFFVAPVALTMPLAAAVYRSRPIAAALAAVGVLSLTLTHAYNEAKPTGLEGKRAVWTLSRSEAQAVLRPELGPVLAAVEHYVRPGGRVGYVLADDDWDYPLYGSQLRNRLGRLPQSDLLQSAEHQGVHWVFLDREALRPPPRATWNAREFPQSLWTMLARSEELG